MLKRAAPTAQPIATGCCYPSSIPSSTLRLWQQQGAATTVRLGLTGRWWPARVTNVAERSSRLAGDTLVTGSDTLMPQVRAPSAYRPPAAGRLAARRHQGKQQPGGRLHQGPGGFLDGRPASGPRTLMDHQGVRIRAGHSGASTRRRERRLRPAAWSTGTPGSRHARPGDHYLLLHRRPGRRGRSRRAAARRAPRLPAHRGPPRSASASRLSPSRPRPPTAAPGSSSRRCPAEWRQPPRWAPTCSSASLGAYDDPEDPDDGGFHPAGLLFRVASGEGRPPGSGSPRPAAARPGSRAD
jgi:hypothetical protein